MRAANHFYKVIDEQTIIIAADTPQNRRIYEDLVIQTFFLSNAEVKDMMTILRSLVDAKKIATNEQLNAIILRDTADKVKVAERIIEANDKAQGRGGGRRRAAADQHRQAARPRGHLGRPYPDHSSRHRPRRQTTARRSASPTSSS